MKEEDKKVYIERLVERVEVSFNKDDNTHNLNFKFRIPIINDGRIRRGKNDFKIVDGEEVLSLKGVDLYGRVYDNEEEKKKLEDIIERSIPPKQTQSVTVE